MPSKSNLDLNGFLEGMPTTSADVEALWAVRQLNRLDAAAYLMFLRRYAGQHPPTREIPGMHEPFRL